MLKQFKVMNHCYNFHFIFIVVYLHTSILYYLHIYTKITFPLLFLDEKYKLRVLNSADCT